MGHRDSPAQFGGFERFFKSHARSAQAPATPGGRGGGEEVTQSRITVRSRSTWLMLFAVRTYVIFLSPFFGGACKFYPSCSQYAQEAISRHGARHGFILALK